MRRDCFRIFLYILVFTAGFMGCIGGDLAGTTNNGNARITASVYHNGYPVPAARVRFRNSSYLALLNTAQDPMVRIDTSTDNDGRFSVVTSGGKTLHLEIADEAGNGYLLSSLTVPNADTVIDLGRLDLSRCGELSITVNSEHLDSLTDIHAAIYGVEHSAHTRAGGVLLFRNLAPGQYKIRITTDRENITGYTDVVTFVNGGTKQELKSVSLPLDYQFDSVLVDSVLVDMDKSSIDWGASVGNRIRESLQPRMGINQLPPSIGKLDFIASLPHTTMNLDDLTRLDVSGNRLCNPEQDISAWLNSLVGNEWKNTQVECSLTQSALQDICGLYEI